MNEQERDQAARDAATGDLDALQRLIVHYHAILSGMLARKLSADSRHHVDVEDVLQEVYVAAFGSLDTARFADAAGFYKWIERIAINDLRDIERGLTRQKRDIRRNVGQPATRDSLIDLVHRVAASDPTPSRHLARDEAIAAALTCLARLTDDQRTAIRLKYFEQMPTAELAKHLGKSEPAIHALCYRALQELRSLLGSISRYL